MSSRSKERPKARSLPIAAESSDVHGANFVSSSAAYSGGMRGIPASSRETSAASRSPPTRTGAAAAARGHKIAASASRRRMLAPSAAWEPQRGNKAPRRERRQALQLDDRKRTRWVGAVAVSVGVRHLYT